MKYLWSLSFAFFAMLCYHGGLMDWQWVLAACFFAVAFFYALVTGHFRLKPFDSVDALTFGVLLSMALSMISSVNLGVSLTQWCALACLWIFWKQLRVAPQPFPSRILGALQILISLFCLAIGINAVILTRIDPTEAERILALPYHAIRFVFPNHNLFTAGLVVPTLCLSVAMIRTRAHGVRNGLLAAFLTFFVLYSGSRGALLGLAAAGVWVCLRLCRRLDAKSLVKLLISAGVLAILAWGFFAYAPFSGLAQRRQQQKDSVNADPYYSMRTEFWKNTWTLARQRPMTGWGLGTLSEDFHRLDISTPLHRLYPLARYRLSLEHAHNEWLELAAESGIFSVMLVAGLVALLFGRWFFSEATPWKLGLEASLVALLAHSCVDFNFHCPPLLFGAALLLAIREPARSVVSENRGASFGLPAFALASLLLSLTLGIRVGRAAQKTSSASAYETALALAPLNVDARTQYADLLMAQSVQDPPQASQALLQLLRALKIAPENAMAHLRYALTLKTISAGAFDSAQLERMGDLLPGWERMAFEHPQAGSREKFFRLYQEACEEALRLKPYDARWRLLLAQTALDEHNPALVQQRLEEAISLEPNYAAAWALKAYSARQRGDRHALKEALLEIKRIEPLGYEKDDLYSSQLRAVDWDWVHGELKQMKY